MNPAPHLAFSRNALSLKGLSLPRPAPLALEPRLMFDAAAVATATKDIAQPCEPEPVNHPPVAVPDLYKMYGTSYLDIDTQYGFLQNDYDPDGGGVFIYDLTWPKHGELGLTDSGRFTYIAEPGFIGKDIFTYNVSDWQARSNFATVTFDVRPASESVAKRDYGCVVEAGIKGPGKPTTSGNLLANDRGEGSAAPRDVNMVQGERLDSEMQVRGHYGTLQISPDGNYTYTLDNDLPAVQSLAAGETLSENFSYAMRQGHTVAASNLQITIRGSNDAPMINTWFADSSLDIPDPNSGPSTTQSQITVSGITDTVTNVWVTLTMDAGATENLDLALVAPDGRRVALMSDVGGFNSARHVQLEINDLAFNPMPFDQPLESGSYRPTNYDDHLGGDDFGGPAGTRLHDLLGGDPNGTWTLRVSNDFGSMSGRLISGWQLHFNTTADHGNVAETGAHSPGKTTAEGRLLATDYDARGPLAWRVVEGGTYGTLSIDPVSGRWIYKLDNARPVTDALAAGQHAYDRCKVRVTDDRGATADYNITMIIEGCNDAPIATGSLPNQSIVAGNRYDFSLPPHLFRDPDRGDTLRLTATLADGHALPSWLHFDPSAQRLYGVACNDNAGPLSITVTATDATGASTHLTYDLNVVARHSHPLPHGHGGSNHHGHWGFEERAADHWKHMASTFERAGNPDQLIRETIHAAKAHSDRTHAGDSEEHHDMGDANSAPGTRARASEFAQSNVPSGVAEPRFGKPGFSEQLRLASGRGRGDAAAIRTSSTLTM